MIMEACMSLRKILNKREETTKQLNTIAQNTGLHSLLVMESTPTHMVVYAANEQEVYSEDDAGPKSNQDGCHELYCERVINTKKPLFVADAKVDKEWAENEDLVKFGLGVYYGIPIIENGEAIGTVCALNREVYNFEEGNPSAIKQIETLKAELEKWLAEAA